MCPYCCYFMWGTMPNVPQPVVPATHQPVPQESEQVVPKKKRKKVSKYSREFGKQLKALKKKHPRTPIQNLMKRAHTATKKALKR